MLRRLDRRGWSDPAADLPRPDTTGDEPRAAVRAILDRVRHEGDDAVLALTEQFDGVRLDSLVIAPERADEALADLEPGLAEALRAAARRIESFHRSTVRGPERHVDGGVEIEGFRVPVDRAGCYVPGGRAIYPSTVLMTAIPAKVAGVGEVVLCVPPDPATGEPPVPVLAAAALAGVDEIYAMGGAQAIGALAYGTKTVRPVDVIVGPGNVYVSLAKQEVAGLVGVPSAFAGPSEIVVIADASTDPAFAAVDVVVQAEHGPHGLAWLITWDEQVADAVDAEVSAIVASSPRSAEITATLAEGGYAVLVDSPEAAMAVANAVAPEHLQLMNADPRSLVPLVRHAGAVFCGPWAPASVGDYLAGPSHVLPTSGTARFSGALGVDDFSKPVHVITLDRSALASVADHVAAIASVEGLAAHADSVRRRVGAG